MKDPGMVVALDRIVDLLYAVEQADARRHELRVQAAEESQSDLDAADRKLLGELEREAKRPSPYFRRADRPLEKFARGVEW